MLGIPDQAATSYSRYQLRGDVFAVGIEICFLNFCESKLAAILEDQEVTYNVIFMLAIKMHG